MESVMASPNSRPDPQAPADLESKGGCLSIIVRLSWIFGGIAVLIYCAVYIAMGRNPGLVDVVYWIIIALIVLIRFVDIKLLKGETLDNKPATLKHWFRYALSMLVAGVILYALAKIVAHFKLI